MQEIKLRAWDVDKKQMCKVVAIDWNDDDIIISAHLLPKNGEAYKVYPNKEYGDNIEFMQYTGRKEKNGKEVSAGDIVSFIDHQFCAEVIYSEEFAAFLFESHNKETINNPNAIMLWDNINEIIGNVHENPELLKGEKCENQNGTNYN